jgi:hypothetical protein
MDVVWQCRQGAYGIGQTLALVFVPDEQQENVAGAKTKPKT